MALKGRISSPLEAGPSVLDGHNLPTPLHPALEYVSKRLARKAAHLTLIVVRRDYQLPSSDLSYLSSARTPASPWSAASSMSASASSTPARPAFNLATLKNFMWNGTVSSNNETERHVPTALDLQRNGMVSPAFSVSSVSSASTATSMLSAADSTFSCLRWPLSPATPCSSGMPMTPATPLTLASSVATTTTTTDGGSAASGFGGMPGLGPFGIRLVNVSPLSSREEKLLKQSIDKAGRRFRIGSDWLPDPAPPSAYGLNVDLMHRSLAQNEVLFSSEGLTLLSLDHLYTFRAALASYARTHSPRRLEDAVDELRRLVLAQGRQKLRKSVLLGAYTWLGPISDAALSNVTRMYRRAYGGAAGESGVENDVDEDVPPTPSSATAYWDEKPLPSLPADAEDAGGRRSTSSSHSGRDLEKRFCVDFDFDLEIEEYYRARAREIQAEKDREAAEAAEAAAAAAEAEAALLEELRRTTPRISPAPAPRMPVLRLQTTFDRRPGVLRPVPVKGVRGNAEEWQGQEQGQGQQVDKQPDGQEEQSKVEELEVELKPTLDLDDEEEEEEEEELTARPKSGHPNTLAASLASWHNSSGMTIDEILNDVESRTSRLGPMTPNGYDDISPITRGEWGFLMVGEGLRGRTAAVEMC